MLLYFSCFLAKNMFNKNQLCAIQIVEQNLFYTPNEVE